MWWIVYLIIGVAVGLRVTRWILDDERKRFPSTEVEPPELLWAGFVGLLSIPLWPIGVAAFLLVHYASRSRPSG